MALKDRKWGLSHVCKKSKMCLLQVEELGVDEELHKCVHSLAEADEGRGIVILRRRLSSPFMPSQNQSLITP